jgi:hypothetical protein
MPANQARYTLDEIARRGQQIYEREVRPTLQPEDDYKFVAIDIESAAFEMDQNDYTSTERLLARCPDPQISLMRDGEPTAYRLATPLFKRT